MFGGSKELMVVFFQCDWFDPIKDTRVDDFGMVEVNHESCYSGNNLLLAHQAPQVQQRKIVGISLACKIIFVWWMELARLKLALCSTMLHGRWSKMPSNMPACYLSLFSTRRCWSRKWSPRRCMASTWPRTNTFLERSMGLSKIRRPETIYVTGGRPRTLEMSHSRTC
jgi:hypothetical protein